MDLQANNLTEDPQYGKQRTSVSTLSDDSFAMTRPKLWKGSKATFKDPFRAHKKKREAEPEHVPDERDEERITLRPSANTRRELMKAYCFMDIQRPTTRYAVPKTKKQLRQMEERRKALKELINFCEYENKRKFAKAMYQKTMPIQMDLPSPNVSAAKVMPHPPSGLYSIPSLPAKEEVVEKTPKTGIIINETERTVDETLLYDSFDLVYDKRPRPKRAEREKKKRKKRRRRIYEGSEEGVVRKRRKKKKAKARLKEESEEYMIGEQALGPADFARLLETGEDDEYYGGEEEDDETFPDESYLTKLFRRQVSQASKATSLNSKDFLPFPSFMEDDIASEPAISRLVQKFRRDSEVQRYKPPVRKILRGTLESHSFTNIKQKVLRNFFFGSRNGSMHQGDEHFSEMSRDKQGICMPVAAFCFSATKHPVKWTQQNIDDILEIGDELYNESMKDKHFHDKGRELRPEDLVKFIQIGKKKIEFTISEPDVSGTVRSRNKSIYNLTKALRIFFRRNCAGIFQCEGHNLLIWRGRFYYLFDATPRARNLYPDPKGAAVVADFYDIRSIVTVLLKRTELDNLPFVISKIELKKLSKKDKEGYEESEQQIQPELELSDERSVFNIVATGKAVVRGSFNLADRCFEFGRNKQAVPMAVVSLVYSRISPPNSWRRCTVDKIMVIGNQLYWECIQEVGDGEGEVTLDMLPAVFTVGPYMVNLFIYAKIFADLVYRKGQSMIEKCLSEFFEKNSYGIVQIGKSTISVWFQRNMFYMFDPYARNSQGLRAREGTACVTMCNELPTLLETLTSNFDSKDEIFYIHAVKVIKIARDPELSASFPVSITMDSYPLEKFKKCKIKLSVQKATEKPVSVDFKDYAMRTVNAWDQELEPSLLEVDSNVMSLRSTELPGGIQKTPVRQALQEAFGEKVADLDSPSLSDTQLAPERLKYEDIPVDVDSYELTMEEQELMGQMGEGEGYLGMEGYYGEGEQDVDEIDEMYLAMHAITQVGSQSLESYQSKISAEVNTDLTCGFLPLKRIELLATNLGERKRLQQQQWIERRRTSFYEPFPTESSIQPSASQEWHKETNFEDLLDGSQLLRGTTNMSAYGEELDFMGPFTAMMASAVSQKFKLNSWSSQVVDYVLKCGAELYAASKVRFDQVPVLDIPCVTLGKHDISIHVECLYDSVMRQKTLENCLKRILFPRSDCGLIVTRTYSCAVFFRNSLFYMYDGFGCNELGLGEGPKNTGVACLARFRTVHELVTRIMHNKSKREVIEPMGYTQFVVSACKAQVLPRRVIGEKMSKRWSKMEKEMEMMADSGEGEEAEEVAEEEEKEEPKPKNKIGYQFYKGFNTIRGTTALVGFEKVTKDVKEDYFACLCAGLTLLNCPVKKWDTEKVDYVLEQGRMVYEHADDLTCTDKRVIRNVLIDKYYFDVLVKKVEIVDWRLNKNLEVGIDTVLQKKWNYFMISLPNVCYLVHKHKDYYHLFDPYGCYPRGRKNKKPGDEPLASWTMYLNLNQLKKRIRSDTIKGAESYNFYSFDIMTLKKAPKHVILAQRLKEYKKHKPPHGEEKMEDRPYNEDETWLDVDPIPWSKVKRTLATGETRGLPDYMWHDWDVEIPKSLYSLFGTLHQTSGEFPPDTRGKQTLANLVVAIGMTQIYDFEEWNVAVVDSIVVHGDQYFQECIKDLTDDDYELRLDDLKSPCTLPPYTFDVRYIPVVEGTVFLVRRQQFNLYKGLRAFFNQYESRCGIICVAREGRRRIVAFGKVREREYFMYDCQAHGPPMFIDGQGSSYVLRCTRLKRLLHVLVVTLRGGDFFIYELEVSNFKTIKADEEV